MSDPSNAQRLRRTFGATAILARTMYRELDRADYSRAEMLQFVNELIGQITDGVRRQSSPADAASPAGGAATPEERRP